MTTITIQTSDLSTKAIGQLAEYGIRTPEFGGDVTEIQVLIDQDD